MVISNMKKASTVYSPMNYFLALVFNRVAIKNYASYNTLFREKKSRVNIAKATEW